jgi:hypothetical protein
VEVIAFRKRAAENGATLVKILLFIKYKYCLLFKKKKKQGIEKFNNENSHMTFLSSESIRV